MPITRRELAPVPFVRPAYEPDTRTLQQLLALAGQSQARTVGQQGQARAQGLMTLGEIISAGLGSLRQEREARAMAEQAAQEKREAENKPIAVGGRLVRPMSGDVVYEPPPEPQRPFEIEGALVDPTGKELYRAPAKPEPGFSLTPGQARFNASGEQIASLPAADPREANPTEASLAMLAARGDKGAQQALDKLRALRAPQGSTTPRSPIWVVGQDGQFQDLAGVAPPGSKPANTREQGRPVVSGDANRIADLDTSLNDLDVLANTVTGSTGTSAKIGAMLPNWVTELTGRGVSAKQKQAAIDRVKQVIGKALEGGVLRKEDELKYEKILPTIYDPPEVVRTKLLGLQEALTLRRQTTLDALADAGYDVSKYQQRTRSGGMVTLIAPDGSEKAVPADQVEHYLSLGAKRKQ